MPEFLITGPDGTKYRVTGPDGATEQDALAQIQSQVQAQPKPEPSFVDRVKDAVMDSAKFGPLAPAMASSALVQPYIDKAAYNAGGKVTDVVSGMGASPETAAKAGLAANVAVQAVPVVLGGEAAKVASPAFVSGAKDLMQSALKPTLKKLQTGEAATAIQTMLDEGLNVTKGGVAKLKDKVLQLNDEIAQAIKNSPASVDKNDVVSRLIPTFNRFRMQVNPSADLAAISKSWDEFINHPMFGIPAGNTLPVQAAQKMKQGTYRELAGKYGQLGSAETESQKALARGLKEEIATAVPEVAGLNAQESKLLTTLSVAERRVLMDANKNPAGLSLLAKSPGAFAAFLADRSPAFKSILARMMYSGSEQIPATAARSGLAALISPSGRE